MPLAIAMLVILALLVLMWVGIARESGPGPADVAIAYERAWDELDFTLIYDLSGNEMRDGLRRDQFVAAKRAAHASQAARLGVRVAVETAVTGYQTALVVTRVEADDGVVFNNVMLERRSNGWVVVSYSLRSDAPTA